MAKSKDPVIIEIEIQERNARTKIAKLNRDIKKTGNFSKDYKDTVVKLYREEKKLNQIQGKRTRHVEALGKSTKGLGNKMEQTSKSTGGAATSVLELGRVVSDAPYGIRGMANNVSQLSSNMLFSAQQIDKTTGKAIGFGNVVKGMGKSFMGPLGILFAIQAVVAGLDYFFGGMKKAESATKKLSEEVGKSVGGFMRVNDILQDNRNSLKQKTEALRVLKKEYPKAAELADFYTESLKSGNTEINKAIELEKEFTKTIIEEAKKRAAKEAIEDESKVMFDLQQERMEDLEETKKYLVEKANLMDDASKKEIKDSIKLLEANYDTAKSFTDQTKEVKEAYKAISDYGKSSKLSGLRIIDFRKALQENGKEIDESNKKITRLSELTKNLFADDGKKQAIKDAEELAKTLQELSIEELQRKVNINDAFLKDETNTKNKKIKLIRASFVISEKILRKENEFRKKDLIAGDNDLAQRKISQIKFNNEFLKLQMALKADLKALNEEGKGDEKTITLLPTPEEFDKEIEDYLDQLAKLQEKTDLFNEESEIEKVEIRKEAHLERLRVKQKEDVRVFNVQAKAYEEEFKAYLAQQVSLGKMTEEESDTALKKFTDKKNLEVKANEDGFKKIIDGWIAFYLDKANLAKKDAEDEARDEKLEKLISYAEKAKEVLSGIGNFIDAEFQRELVMEQNKTNEINNQLKKRLRNENLSKNGRQAIQDEIARNDEALRKKQEAIEKKRFKMQKAVDMSTVIIDTAVAMMKALKVYGPTPQGFVAMGLAAASGAVQLAAISRQKFQSSAAGSPRVASGTNGSSGSGGEDRAEASFNIVGMGDNNQLLEAIQARFDQPLKAYVVSREVTRQQNLDASINTGASI
tara:strand:+ start:1289 stop:3889 length:2601 start_codon:yes stop_codon:yes gene_type:complete